MEAQAEPRTLQGGSDPILARSGEVQGTQGMAVATLGRSDAVVSTVVKVLFGAGASSLHGGGADAKGGDERRGAPRIGGEDAADIFGMVRTLRRLGWLGAVGDESSA